MPALQELTRTRATRPPTGTALLRGTLHRPGLRFARCVLFLIFPLVQFMAAAATRSEAVEAPMLLGYTFELPPPLPDGQPRPLQNGDAVVLLTRWTVADSVPLADGLTVTADWTRLERGASTLPFTENLGGGEYRIHYVVPAGNTRPDTSAIPVPLTATIPGGPSTVDSRILVCLSNAPPIHRGSILERRMGDPAEPYRTGDTLEIVTRWRSESGLPMTVVAELGQVLRDSAATETATVFDDSTWTIRYRIPLNVDLLREDGPKVIRLRAQDSGCGRTTTPEDEAIRFLLDTTPPDTSRFSVRRDLLPPITTLDSVTVVGSAPASQLVHILRNRTVRATGTPDAEGNFAIALPLLMGDNEIHIQGEDEVRNKSALFPFRSPPVVVRVSGAELIVPPVFSRRDRGSSTTDDIILRDPSGIREARLRIFNLEGDCILETTHTGPSLEFRIHWDGRGTTGERAPQGYYVIRVDYRTHATGESRRETRGLLLKD